MSKPFGTFFLPGPTEVRPEILEAMLAPMLPHRGAEFEAMFGRMVSLLQPIFRTTRPVYVSTSSATGFMEMAVRCAPPGPILSIVNGAFSERFADIARAVGRDVTVLDVPWGQVVQPDALDAALRDAATRSSANTTANTTANTNTTVSVAANPGNRAFAAVTVVHSETSTGALTPLPELARIAHVHDALLLVDSVTGLAGAPVETDAWDIDVLLTGSQKALALPPGLAFAAVSERFLESAARAEARGRYFDVLEFEQYAKKQQTPNTPAISLLYATLAQAEAIATETIEARWARHAAMAEYMYQWITRTGDSLGIPLGTVADAAHRSPTVTAISLPGTVRGSSIVADVAARGFVIGSGYGKLKDSSIRIGHMGDHTVEGLARCLDAVEGALRTALRDVSASR